MEIQKKTGAYLVKRIKYMVEDKEKDSEQGDPAGGRYIPRDFGKTW